MKRNKKKRHCILIQLYLKKLFKNYCFYKHKYMYQNDS